MTKLRHHIFWTKWNNMEPFFTFSCSGFKLIYEHKAMCSVVKNPALTNLAPAIKHAGAKKKSLEPIHLVASGSSFIKKYLCYSRWVCSFVVEE